MSDILPPSSQEEEKEIYGLSSEKLSEVVDCLKNREPIDKIWPLIEPLHAADLADLIEALNSEDLKHFATITQQRLDPELLVALDEHVREELIKLYDTKQIAAVVRTLESDDAVEVIEDLSEDEQQNVLKAIPIAERSLIEEGLSYPEDSAGRLMQREIVAVPSFWTVGEIIDFMRTSEDLPNDFYDVFIVDPKYHPLGSVPLSRVLRNNRSIAVSDLITDEIRTVPVDMDQEDVAYLFRQYSLASAPVINDEGRLVGVITVDDVVYVIDEEAEEDLMKLGGVTETDLYSAAYKTCQSRFSWLLINLGTAILASIVIACFENTIDKIVSLAILMPIVASMGGNAGTQTLTVVVRALATKSLTELNTKRVVTKEFIVGLLNGIAFALLMGTIAWLWFDDQTLGIVVSLSMLGTIMIAGLAGALIPIFLEKLNIDPAVASGVFLTTATDVIGFFTFLGLAALILL